MELLLRIIDQTLSQCEQQKTYPLGNEGYSCVAKVKNGIDQSEPTLFESSVKEYFKGVPCSSEEKENVGVVVFGKTRPFIIKKHEVAYIVNNEGKTIERIYGQYVKY